MQQLSDSQAPDQGLHTPKPGPMFVIERTRHAGASSAINISSRFLAESSEQFEVQDQVEQLGEVEEDVEVDEGRGKRDQASRPHRTLYRSCLDTDMVPLAGWAAMNHRAPSPTVEPCSNRDIGGYDNSPGERREEPRSEGDRKSVV